MYIDASLEEITFISELNILMKIDEIVHGQYAPLYHGTDLISLTAILRDDSLKEGAYWSRVGEPHGVRLTRDLRVAWNYGDADIPWHGILVFDQARIRHRYRIVQYRDVDVHGDPWSVNEMEEVILTNELPVSPFLIQIILDTNDLKHISDKEYAIYAIDHGLFKTQKDYFSALEVLRRHPLLKHAKNPNPY